MSEEIHFTKPELEHARTVLQAALDAACEEAGLESCKIGRITYGEAHFSAKIDAQKKGGLSVEASDFLHFAKMDVLGGLKPEHLGAEFERGGEKYRLDGYKRKARKNDMALTRLSDGSARVAPREFVMRGFGITDTRRRSVAAMEDSA